jgi:homoserine O-acetyltransferase/O-succinyltransferase
MSCYLGQMLLTLVTILIFAEVPALAQQPTEQVGDFVIHNFTFRSGETMPELKLHYLTIGKPARDSQGRVTNAVMILHSTGDSGRQFMVPRYAGALFGPGQLLDANRYYIILPDSIGAGGSSKPSDGLHMRFPKYDFDDMVASEYRLATDGLGVNHLRLIIGTSMGCMVSWVWAETYPDFMDAVMPMACLPVEIVGRNRIYRLMQIDAIRNDPEWKGGEYTSQPSEGIRMFTYLRLLAAGMPPLQMQKNFPTPEATDKYFENFVSGYIDNYLKTFLIPLDANNEIYQVDASRNYNPSPLLEKINAQVMFINSADDFIDPPELGIAEREIKKVKNGRFVLLPISDQSVGHLSYVLAALWEKYLSELLMLSAR